jgi:hypothetical protein
VSKDAPVPASRHAGAEAAAPKAPEARPASAEKDVERLGNVKQLRSAVAVEPQMLSGLHEDQNSPVPRVEDADDGKVCGATCFDRV